MQIEHIVIGDYKSFKLALGKHAFVSCGYIPREYLECLINTNISDKDKEIISEYLKNNLKLL